MDSETPGLAKATTTPAMSKPAAKPRVRPSRAAEPTGKVHPREMTKFRDRVGELRDVAIALPQLGEQTRKEAIADNLIPGLVELFTDLDRLDLRFKIHHDPSVIAAAGKKK